MSAALWTDRGGHGAVKGAAALGLASLLLAGCVRPEGDVKELLYSFWGSIEQQRADRQIIEEFEAENPGIRVRMLPVGQRYAEKIQAMLLGSVAPDLMMLDIAYYDKWASSGVLMDVTSLVEELEREDPLMDLPRRTFERDGRFYAAPLNVHGWVLCVNLEALEKADIRIPKEGWSWQEFREMAPRLSRLKGDPEALTDYALLMPPQAVIFLTAWGTKLFDDLERPTRVTANTEEVREALEFCRELSMSGYAVPPDVKEGQGTFQLFRDGKVAFFFTGRWFLPEIADKTDFAWDIVPVPHGPAGRRTSHGGTGLGIWKDTRHPEEARRFLKFYAGKHGAEHAMKSGRYVPVYEKLAHSEKFLSLRPEALHHLVDTMKPGVAEAVLYGPGYTDVSRMLGRRVDQMIYRGVSTEQATDGLQRDLEHWLERQEARRQ